MPPGGQAALDIGIMSLDATGAGDDCREAMYQKKMSDYAPYLRSLNRQGIRYKPLTFSCYGRGHPEALATLFFFCEPHTPQVSTQHAHTLQGKSRSCGAE